MDDRGAGYPYLIKNSVTLSEAALVPMAPILTEGTTKN